jgi:site-specific recombinase XerD
MRRLMMAKGSSMSYAIARHRSGLLPPEPTGNPCHRVFNNDQLIARFGEWLQVCGKARNTQVNYAVAAKQFAAFLVDKPLTAATKEDVRGFIGSLYTKGWAPATLQARLDALRSLFDCLQLGGQVRESVPRYVLRRKLPKRLPVAKSEEEIGQLIAAARTLRDRAILEIAYASALRISELVRLNVEDVNLRARSLIVREGKGGNDRIGLFGRKAAEALQAYLGDRKTGPLFVAQQKAQRGSITRDRWGSWRGWWRETAPNGKHVKRSVRLGDYELPTKERAREALDAFLKGKLPTMPSTNRLVTRSLYRVIVKAAKRAGLTGIHPHILRHSCATHCLNRGMDIRFVQELLGHTSLVATQKYLHLSTANLLRVHREFFPEGDHEEAN